MKISTIKQKLTKANNAESRYNRALNELLNECQHCCNYKLDFCEYQPSDGFCLGYSTDDLCDNLISVKSFIELVLTSKRRLKLEDLIKTF